MCIRDRKWQKDAQSIVVAITVTVRTQARTMPSPAKTAHITHLARYVISTCMRRSWKITICNFNYSSTQNSRSHIRLLHSLILSAHKYNNGTRWNNCLLLAFQRWFSSSLLPADRYRHLTECIAVCLYGRIPLLLPRQIRQIKGT